jgi:hypothetical protein
MAAEFLYLGKIADQGLARISQHALWMELYALHWVMPVAQAHDCPYKRPYPGAQG